MKYCIHNKSENQRCRLCHFHSDCCDDLVTESKDENGTIKTICYKCDRECNPVKINLCD